MSYGTSITADAAKKVAAPAIAEARKNNWMMAIAIVDIAGELVYFEKMDDTQIGSVNVAISKARSAARFKRATKAFQDALAAGGEGLRILALDGAIPVDGGLPIVVGGKIVGAIGASRLSSSAGCNSRDRSRTDVSAASAIEWASSSGRPGTPAASIVRWATASSIFTAVSTWPISSCNSGRWRGASSAP